MRNIPQLLVAAIVLASQVTNALPSPVTAQSSATALPVGSNQTKIVLTLSSPEALASTYVKPNIETEMLTPARAYQAEQAAIAAVQAAQAAAAAKAAAARKLASKTVVKAVAYTGQVLSQAQITFLGNCESGMTWNRNSGNGFYGAFQFSAGTWNAMQTGYARADLAPLDIQISAVQKLLSRSSIYGQFPGCSKKMVAAGLL